MTFETRRDRDSAIAFAVADACVVPDAVAAFAVFVLLHILHCAARFTLFLHKPNFAQLCVLSTSRSRL